MKEHKATSFRLTPEAKRLLEDTAQHLGVSRAAVIEMAIREFAKQKLPDDQWRG